MPTLHLTNNRFYPTARTDIASAPGTGPGARAVLHMREIHAKGVIFTPFETAT